MQRLRIAIVGLGKIAREEHIPALRANDDYEVVAAVGPEGRLEGAPCFATIESMLQGGLQIDAVAICTPPQSHGAPARAALEAGCHVLLEKPPCATVEEFDGLAEIARRTNRTLFQTWHARETPVVDKAADWLSARTIRSGKVVWKEDVRHWHPHQSWIWREGGFGVLDAGINAISILTRILPVPLAVEAAHLLIPANCETPIAAAVSFRTAGGALIDADFDFRHPTTQDRTITVETDGGRLVIVGHGAELQIDGELRAAADQSSEYAALYRRFAGLIAGQQSETDKRPLELVSEIFRLGGRSAVAAFAD